MYDVVRIVDDAADARRMPWPALLTPIALGKDDIDLLRWMAMIGIRDAGRHQADPDAHVGPLLQRIGLGPHERGVGMALHEDRIFVRSLPPHQLRCQLSQCGGDR